MMENHFHHHRCRHRHHHRRRPSRGIKNVSHVSCHLACAVQIVVNAMPPIRRSLEKMSCLSSLPSQEVAKTVATTTTMTTTIGGDDGNSIDPTLTRIIQELLDFMTSSDNTEDNPSIDDDDAWDPSKLYRYLHQADDTIDAYNVGDSSSSLSKLLRVLSKVSSGWDELLKFSVWNGQTRQVLIGTKRLSEKQYIRRFKRQSKTKQMACPLVIKVPSSSSSLSSSLSSNETKTVSLNDCITAMVEPQIVQGEYPWENQSPETYTEQQLDDDDDDDSRMGDCTETVSSSYDTWTTTKQVQFEEIPRVWLLHLERPDWQQQQQQPVGMKNEGDDNSCYGEKSEDFIKINVPIQLDLTNFATSDDKKLTQSSKAKSFLTLTGAIIQVRYFDDDDDDEDHGRAYPNDDTNDDEGHCFTILRNSKDDDDNDNDDRTSIMSSNWMKLDDGKQVSMISEERALDLIGGCVTKTSTEGRRRTFSFASLLVYSREAYHHNGDDDWSQCIDSISESWKIVLGKNDEVHRKEVALVGRRLKVKWAKEKYYSGTVTSYDPMTGKHRVTYDDGDIRAYCLAKKTIAWIDED